MWQHGVHEISPRNEVEKARGEAESFTGLETPPECDILQNSKTMLVISNSAWGAFNYSHDHCPFATQAANVVGLLEHLNCPLR